MEKLSELDALFLASETPTQHLHVLATLVLDRSKVPGVWDYGTFRTRLAERFHLVEPMRRRPVQPPLSRPYWEVDPDLHIDRHLHHLVLDGGGLPALAAAAGEIASFPLARDRPLWEAWFVEGMTDHEVAVISKMHHCAVDGVSGIYVLGAFLDIEPFPSGPAADPADPVADPVDAADDEGEDHHADAMGTVITAGASRPGPVELGRSSIVDLARQPLRTVRGIRRIGGSVLATASARSRSAPLPFSAPRQSYNHALTPRRTVAFTTIRFDDIKQIRRGLGASVNDVLVALCAGVLRRYAERHGEIPGRPLVAAVPISERRPEHGAVGNQISFMFYALPVHLADPVERLEEVTRSATEVKDLYDRAGTGLMGGLAAVAPSGVVGPLMRLVSGMRVADVAPPVANVLISNIRGPDLPLYMAGAELTTIFPMGPLAEGIGLGLTVVSYRDSVALGFIGCTDLMEDMDELVELTDVEVATMLDTVASLD